MTRGDHRAKCIEAMYRRARHHPSVMWHSDVACKEAMADILDSLHGIAFVDPIEATEEMLEDAWHLPCLGGEEPGYGDVWRAMAAAGDLTEDQNVNP